MNLLARRTLQIDLPEFLVKALEERVVEANMNPSSSSVDAIDVNDLIEWKVAELVTVQDVALLEQRVPGFAAAVSAWVAGMTFDM